MEKKPFNLDDINFSDWLENRLAPLNDILLGVEKIEDKTYNLTRDDFFANKSNVAVLLQKDIIEIGKSLGALKNSYLKVLNKYSSILCNKFVQLAKALEKGYWLFVYQIAWRFVSSDVQELKKVVLNLFELTLDPELLKI